MRACPYIKFGDISEDGTSALVWHRRDVAEKLHLTEEQFVDMCIYMGNDYTKHASRQDYIVVKKKDGEGHVADSLPMHDHLSLDEIDSVVLDAFRNQAQYSRLTASTSDLALRIQYSQSLYELDREDVSLLEAKCAYMAIPDIDDDGAECIPDLAKLSLEDFDAVSHCVSILEEAERATTTSMTPSTKAATDMLLRRRAEYTEQRIASAVLDILSAAAADLTASSMSSRAGYNRCDDRPTGELAAVNALCSRTRENQLDLLRGLGSVCAKIDRAHLAALRSMLVRVASFDSSPQTNGKAALAVVDPTVR
jgi:hypothetical protein